MSLEMSQLLLKNIIETMSPTHQSKYTIRELYSHDVHNDQGKIGPHKLIWYMNDDLTLSLIIFLHRNWYKY